MYYPEQRDKGKMNRIECKPFAFEHIEAAKKIALDNYNEEREYVQELPEAAELWDIGFFVENGYGVVALEEGSVVGYLCFFNPWSGAFDTEDSLGTFSPLHANGAIKKNRYRIYQDMYEYAAMYLASKNIKGLGVCLYAHDEISKNALFEYGFGMRCKDSIQKISAFCQNQIQNSDLKFEELKVEDFPLLHEHRHDLHEHLKESPCFMQADADDYKRWITKVDEGDRRTFIAKLGDEIVAYVDIAEEGENFVTVHPKMRNIQGAYCKPEYRGMKIYGDLLTFVAGVLKEEGYEYLGVDFESYNPTANRFWSKHFNEYTNSVTRRIELWCKDYSN